MPDPAIFGTSPKDDEDQDGRGVGQKAKVERAASAGKVAAGPAIRAPARLAANIDLIGGVDAPQRPSTTEPVSRQPPSKAPAAPPKQTKPADSLLGLDFFGGTQSAPPERPASVTTNSSSSVPSRPDLKQSILSLYASAPRAAAPPQQPQHQRGSSSGDFQGFQSPPLQSPTQMNQGAAGGLNDAFSSLSFASTSSPPTQQTKPSPFANLASSATSRRQPSTASASSFGGGGSFFDAPSQKPMPTSPPAQPSAPQRGFSQSSGFGDFFSATSPIATQPPPKPTNPMSGGGGDLFDLAMPSQPAAPAPKPISPTMNAFNLSAPTQPQQPLAPKPQAAPAPMANFSSDPWGSNDVWGSSNNEAPVPAPAPKAPMPSNGISNDFGWGSSAAAKPTSPPKITQDDDFGGWSSAPAPAQQQQPPPPKPSGGGFSSNNDDLFSNVWE